MHDCPTCQVPLHGHEEVCPSCGTKQYVKPEFRRSNLPKAPGVNPMPFIVVLVGLVLVIFVCAQNSWIGQVFHRGPVVEDPMDKMTILDARNAIETQINQGLTAVGSTAKFAYKVAGEPSTKDVQKPCELTVDTELKDPKQHKSIVDPIKQYMEKAQVLTLTMNDSKSHATWTYNLGPAAQEAPAQ
jgi:hypothetical protein